MVSSAHDLGIRRSAEAASVSVLLRWRHLLADEAGVEADTGWESEAPTVQALVTAASQ